MSSISIGLISLCVIIVMMSPRSATGLLFLFPAYGLYLFFDNKLLNLWRVKIIDALKAMAIDLDAIRQALIANKTLPSETLQGMLDTLPEAGD